MTYMVEHIGNREVKEYLECQIKWHEEKMQDAKNSFDRQMANNCEIDQHIGNFSNMYYYSAEYQKEKEIVNELRNVMRMMERATV